VWLKHKGGGGGGGGGGWWGGGGRAGGTIKGHNSKKSKRFMNRRRPSGIVQIDKGEGSESGTKNDDTGEEMQTLDNIGGLLGQGGGPTTTQDIGDVLGMQERRRSEKKEINKRVARRQRTSRRVAKALQRQATRGLVSKPGSKKQKEAHA